MNLEADSREYNKTVLENRIVWRMIVTLAITLLLFLFSRKFNCFGDGVFLGALCSLMITAIYSFLDLYINIYEAIDKEREKFVSGLNNVLIDFNNEIKKHINSDLESQMQNIFDGYVCKVFNYVCCDSKNDLGIYTLTHEFYNIEKYIKQVFMWFSSCTLLTKDNFKKVEQRYREEILLEESGIHSEIVCAKKMASKIIEKKITEIDIRDLDYFIMSDSKKGNILKSQEKSVSNIILKKIESMQEMDDIMHKKEVRRLFFDSIKNGTSNIMKKFLKMLKKVFITLFLLLLLLLIIGLAEGFFIWH